MAGLNFQTQTIINSNLDPDSGKGVVLFEGKEEKVDGVQKDVLKIKRDFLFVKIILIVFVDVRDIQQSCVKQQLTSLS